MPIRSLELWLTGMTDAVEYGEDGSIRIVEYKRGRPKKHRADEVQLCAQAMCLEEMTGKAVPLGAIYHATSHRRREVAITQELRQAVETCVAEVRAALAAPTLPPPVNDRRCHECSLIDLCQPTPLAQREKLHTLAAHLFEPDA